MAAIILMSMTLALHCISRTWIWNICISATCALAMDIIHLYCIMLSICVIVCVCVFCVSAHLFKGRRFRQNHHHLNILYIVYTRFVPSIHSRHLTKSPQYLNCEIAQCSSPYSSSSRPAPYTPFVVVVAWHVRLVIVVNPFKRPGNARNCRASWVVQHQSDEPRRRVCHSAHGMHLFITTNRLGVCISVFVCDRRVHTFTETQTYKHIPHIQEGRGWGGGDRGATQTHSLVFSRHTRRTISMRKYVYVVFSLGDFQCSVATSITYWDLRSICRVFGLRRILRKGQSYFVNICLYNDFMLIL